MAKKTNTKAKTEIIEPSKSQYIADRLKILLKNNEITFNDLAEKMGITSNGLYLSFKRGKVTISTLEKIGKVLDVHPFYFFENDIIDRLTEEAAKYPQNPDLKSFLMGFSRDVSKGMPVEQAAHKNIDLKDYTIGLLM